MSRSVPRRGWAGAGDVLLVVLVTALQVTGPRSGSPGHVPDLLAGLAGTTLGVAAALAGGVALWWRRSWPVGVLAVCVAGYAVNAAVVPAYDFSGFHTHLKQHTKATDEFHVIAVVWPSVCLALAWVD